MTTPTTPTTSTNAPASLLAVDDARALILGAVDVVGAESVYLPSADGRTLAETLTSKRDVPAFDNSAMDGVGVRVADVAAASSAVPVRLRIAGSSLPGHDVAGQSGALPLEPGNAVRIMTGAPVPAGVEAVVMRESTDESEVEQGFIAVKEAAPAGQHIRKRGEDVSEGSIVGRAGDVVTPARMNLLLATGHSTALVRRRITVGVVASGDELKEVGAALGAGDVVNSNAHAVAAAARACGCEVHLLGIAGDSLDDHVTRIEQGLSFDVVITIGGVSMGTHDFVRPALEKLGVALHMWRVAMKPGKPIAFGSKDKTKFFGLPGNPVSSMVSFELFVRPALAKMHGLLATSRPLFSATLVDSELKKKPGLEHWARGSARISDGKLLVRVFEGQGSHQISVLARANALVKFPREGSGAAAGDVVEVLLLEDPLTFPS